MNHEARALAAQYKLDEPQYFDLRVQFALQCTGRSRHLIVDATALDLLKTGLLYPAAIDRQQLAEAAAECRRLANSHQGNLGNESLDGAGHAAVSATFGLSCALSGDAWHAAEYAAYSLVYSYAGHAVTDPAAFAVEYSWQCRQLSLLLNSIEH